jgi:N-acetyl-anhydromuramyl-L-alanine amidase AmpD
MRRMRNDELTPAHIAKAVEILKPNPPMDSRHPFELDGRPYEARIEWHENKTKGRHKGVSLFVADPPLVLPSSAKPPPKQTLTLGDVEGVPFIAARNFTRGPRNGAVRLVVIHTAECDETNRAAENLAAWAAGPNAPQASWHYAVDADSVTQSVLERDVAWHAPGVNGVAIGVEHAGRAKQLAGEWADAYSRTLLARSAVLVAGICQRWHVPARRLTASEVLAGAAGICGHKEVSDAFKRSSHWDPGPAFPWAIYLEIVSNQLAVGAEESGRAPIPGGVIGIGAKGATVARWQSVLIASGHALKADGIFGPLTHAATVSWQGARHLTLDGIVGRDAWHVAIQEGKA